MKYKIVNISKNKCTIIIGKRYIEPGGTRFIDEKEILTNGVRKMFESGSISIDPAPWVVITATIINKEQADLFRELSEAKIEKDIPLAPAPELTTQEVVAQEVDKPVELVEQTVKRRKRKVE